MNCPKCGYTQEERLDCRKCGIVFSKYNLLHPPRAVATEDPEVAQLQPSAVEDPVMEIADLRQSLRDLSQRLSEMEFERAERTQLRTEIRALDQRIQGNLTSVQEQLSALDARLAELRASAPGNFPENTQRLKNELQEEQLSPLLRRLDEVERRLSALPKEHSNGAVQAAEGLRKLEERVTQSENDIASLAELSRAEAEDSPEGIGKLSKDIEELRGSLQNVTVRYSEIGELKKNHLVLLNKVESFQLQLDQARTSPEQVVSNRVPELETEVLALRADVRQTLKKLEALEATASVAPANPGLVSEELEKLRKLQDEQIEQMRADCEALVEKALIPLSDIPNRLVSADQRQLSLAGAIEEIRQDGSQKIGEIETAIAALRSEQEKIKSELRWSEEKISAILSRPPEEPRPPLEEDVHIIRETMEQVRRLLNSTARKP